MHDQNGTIDTRLARTLAPDLVAAISDEGLNSLTPSPYFCIGPHCAPKEKQSFNNTFSYPQHCS